MSHTVFCQNSDAETAFFNGMAVRVMRALDFLKSLPQWNGKDLTAVGGSQGGLQVMWAAALDPDVSEAYPGITWCCDLAGQSKKGRAHGPWRIKYTPALDYYDPVFMAKRIKKAKVVITRAGLGDYTCPPSGLAVCYKNRATPDKTICWYQGSHHNFIPADSVITTWSTSAE
jgi:cephalosporin-C deacetylase-like acetyl esterase